MKKKLTSLFLALVMCMTLGVPAFAAHTDDGNSGIMPCEDDYRCHHTPPSGYVYQEYIEGNTVFDAVIETGILTLTAAAVPELGPTCIVIGTASTVQTVMNWVEDGRLRTTYHRYIYKKGTDYWYHTYWYYRGADGYLHYLACETDT